MARPVATNKPIMADMMALPEPGSMYAKAGDIHKLVKVISTETAIFFNLIIPDSFIIKTKLYSLYAFMSLCRAIKARTNIIFN